MGSDATELCYSCKTGRFQQARREVAFNRETDKGRIACRVSIPVHICEHCGTTTWDTESEVILRDAARREYERLARPPACA